MDVKFCGICHTDVHFVKELSPYYPFTPGHELAGVVTRVGRNVTKLKAGDNVAVGCLVDSCFGCRPCRSFEEQYCVNGNVPTYGGETKYGRAGPDHRRTHGGYSDRFVVNQRFAFKLPDFFGKESELAKCAPLLCAGVTTFDPLVRYECQPHQWENDLGVSGRKRVGVVGFGGLGHMAVKIAVSFKCEAVVLSTSPQKEDVAKRMGAEEFWLTTDRETMDEKKKRCAKTVVTKRDAPVYGWQNPDPPERQTEPREGTKDPAPSGSDERRTCLDLILDTVSAPHDIQSLVDVLAPDGTLVLLGLGSKPFELMNNAFVFTRKVVRGSLIAGTRNTEACVAWCVDRGIFPEVEIIDAAKASGAMKLLDQKNDRAVRYVIDCGTIPKSTRSPSAA